MTTRHPLRHLPLTQMTNFPAVEEQVVSERQHCADKPNKCKTEIQNQSIGVITGWSFAFLKEENNGAEVLVSKKV